LSWFERSDSGTFKDVKISELILQLISPDHPINNTGQKKNEHNCVDSTHISASPNPALLSFDTNTELLTAKAKCPYRTNTRTEATTGGRGEARKGGANSF
jgi:hypothetical protein